jgi:hypothetical protein
LTHRSDPRGASGSRRLRHGLSIGKIGGGNGDPRYYIDNVAQGKEDYYSGRGEAPGQWLGTAAASDGLTGPVDDEQFLGLLGAGTAQPRKVLGYDLAFSAPNPSPSSTEWGIGPSRLSSGRPTTEQSRRPSATSSATRRGRGAGAEGTAWCTATG